MGLASLSIVGVTIAALLRLKSTGSSAWHSLVWNLGGLKGVKFFEVVLSSEIIYIFLTRSQESEISH